MDRAALVRRNTALLTVAQGAQQGTVPVILAVGSVAAVELSGRETLAGALMSTYFIAAAGSAFVVGRLMDRYGRRPGLLAGYVMLGVGGALSGIAVLAGSVVLLLLAAAVFGAGAGAALLGRAAVADMHPPETRGRAMGILLAAGVVGAVGGPPLVGLVQQLGSDRGIDPLVLPWFLVPALALVGLACVAAVRPDPRDLAISAQGPATGEPDRSRRQLFELAPFRAAVVAALIAQASMVAVMGVTPVVIHDHGGSSLMISLVISAHLAGMFGLSPLIGAALDRWGRRRGLVAGCFATAIGAPLAAIEPGSALVGVGLFLVGVGWSTCYLGATAVISDVTAATERGAALGLTDLVASLTSAIGALAGGLVLEVAGFTTLGFLVPLAVIPALVLALRLREEAPGRWVGPAASDTAVARIVR